MPGSTTINKVLYTVLFITAAALALTVFSDWAEIALDHVRGDIGD